ncbi:hypothetical protein BHE74_00030369 [Ensete ventricosum]|nr:hypothetical protein BHE74_00030369 [Ensete ventricosum]
MGSRLPGPTPQDPLGLGISRDDTNYRSPYPPARLANDAPSATVPGGPVDPLRYTPGPTPDRPDTLSSDATFLRAQLRLVTRHLDEVQREFTKSKEELEEGSIAGSRFVPEIQDKPILVNFYLPTLESLRWELRPGEACRRVLGPNGPVQYLRYPDVSGISHHSQRFFWSLVQRPTTIVPKMLQRANQYITVATLVAEKRKDHKRPCMEQSRGQALGSPKRKLDRPELSLSRPP